MKMFIKKLFKTTMAAIITVFAFGCGSSETTPQQGQLSSGSSATSSSESSGTSDQGVGRFAGKDVAPFDEALATAGEAVFVSKCSACHKTTADKVVGPGLKGVTERRKPQWILNMITNPTQMTQQDPTAQSLLAEHLTQMADQNVSDEDAMKLLNYLRKNDAAK